MGNDPTYHRREISTPFFAWALPVLLIILTAGCSEPEVELTRTDRRMVDSLFQQEKMGVDSIVDSICRAWANENLTHFKDSLMEKRWSEIKQILESHE